jgi:hypothetical protein
MRILRNGKLLLVGGKRSLNPECCCDNPPCIVCVQLGTNGTFTAPCTGTLSIGYNDDNFGDNSAPETWDVNFPDFGDFDVGNDEALTLVGPVVQGNNYSFSASGCVSHAFPGAPAYDPDGVQCGGSPNPFDTSNIPPGGFRCPGLAYYSLVAQIHCEECPEEDI